MLGWLPAWLLWGSAGYTAKGVLDRIRPQQQQGQPGQLPPGAPRAMGPQQQPQVAPRSVPVAGPPQARAGAPCQFDAHMDERTERAVMKCLQEGDPGKLRGFAASVTDQLPPHAYPAHYFPIAAFVMRQQAVVIDMQRAQAAQAAAAAAPPAPVPQPQPAPAPAAPKAVNGIAAVSPAAASTPTPDQHPEG